MSDQNTRSCLVRVSGRVTGVGFRYSAVGVAMDLPSLRGHVRNLPDGRVESRLQGKAAEVGTMIEWLRRGPPLARVADLTISEVPAEDNLPAFRIT